MQAGKLRHRIQIYSATESRDANGGFVKSWELSAIVWASIEPLAGRELFQAQQVNSQVSHKIRMRYKSINASQRLIHATNSAGRFFQIEGIVNPEMIEDEIQLLVREASDPNWQILYNDDADVVFNDSGATILVGR